MATMLSTSLYTSSIFGTLPADYRHFGSAKCVQPVVVSQNLKDPSFKADNNKSFGKSDFANQLSLNSNSHKNHSTISTDALSTFYSVSTSDSYDELSVYRGLVLDFSYRPVNVVCWKRALCLDILEKADVLEYYDQVVRSASRAFPIPAVLRMSSFTYVPKQRGKVVLSRNNLLMRDKFRCQYCGSKESLTIDHVKAVSKGGKSNWENLVTACFTCNSKKGDKTPAEVGMKLLKVPREPKGSELRDFPPSLKTSRTMLGHSLTPPQWQNWLPLKPKSHY